MSTVMEQMQLAALALACAGPIKDRLASAYRDHLAAIESADLPRDLADDLIAVRRAMVRERPLCRSEDAVQATVRKMSNDEASRHAAAVVKIFAGVARTGTGNASRRVRNPASAPIVNLFAADG